MDTPIHISRSGQRFGPYPATVIQVYLVEGRLFPTDLAWREGEATWRPLSDFPEFSASQLPPVAPPLPPTLIPPPPPPPKVKNAALAAKAASIEGEAPQDIGKSIGGAIAGAAFLIFVVMFASECGSSTNSSTSSGGTNQQASITKAQWKAKVAQHFPMFRTGTLIVSSTDFKRAMGEPDSTQTLGDKAMWYYECSDGMIQMVLWSSSLQFSNQVVAEQVNDY